MTRQAVSIRCLLVNGVIVRVREIRRDDHGLSIVTTAGERFPATKIVRIYK